MDLGCTIIIGRKAKTGDNVLKSPLLWNCLWIISDAVEKQTEQRDDSKLELFLLDVVIGLGIEDDGI
ncbi:hypothetical protein C5167_036071 [Papaver somniferum]|nr:hypothetical protein C5167_036071 [Papaver somniferum]